MTPLRIALALQTVVVIVLTLGIMKLERIVKSQQAQIDRYAEEVDDRPDAPPNPIAEVRPCQ